MFTLFVAVKIVCSILCSGTKNIVFFAPIYVMLYTGSSKILSQNNSLLLLKYVYGRLLEPTEGSPDVVPLLKYASLVSLGLG